ncbi:YfhD family protein [Paenibacillus ginsengihumi]|jgi:hypothetical protein|nr:YfhD family protein [Paenibacillus ginsengihumi]
MNRPSGRKEASGMPIGKKEDVEFSRELADQDDLKAQERAAAADTRQQQE